MMEEEAHTAGMFTMDGGDSGEDGFVRHERSAPAPAGRVRVRGRRKEYCFDKHQGVLDRRGQFSAGCDSVLTDKQAKEAMNAVFVAYAVDRQTEGFLFDFTDAMFMYHALNGASVIQPGRASFTVWENEYDPAIMLEALTPYGIRRFFRHYADDVRHVIEAALVRANQNPTPSLEAFAADVKRIAQARGLVLYPGLIHDSADFCTLSAAESAAVQSSKRQILETTENNVDGVKVVRASPGAGRVVNNGSSAAAGYDSRF